jgi:hypothetical protein
MVGEITGFPHIVRIEGGFTRSRGVGLTPVEIEARWL